MLSKLAPSRVAGTGTTPLSQADRPQPCPAPPMRRPHRPPVAAIAAALVLATIGVAGTAHAAPPPVGSDDWNIMHPYAEWVTTQHDRRGYWCCDIGDGRPVEARIAADGSHWEVHITKTHFPDEPDHWLVVPDGKITAGGNPTGTPIVWLLHGNVQCFAPPDGA